MRCLIISDIHANFTALETVLAHAHGQYDMVLCLGDVVGYGPDPNECVERVRSLPNVICLVGNHDWAALGLLDLQSFNPDARAAAQFTTRKLSPTNRAYLESLQPAMVLDVRGIQVTVTHASPRHPIWEYILDSTIADANFEAFTTAFCFVGHTHTAMLFRRPAEGGPSVAEPPTYNEGIILPAPGGERLIINPGSVGQPRDSDPRAAYAIVDFDTLTYTAYRVPYPIERTQERMRQAGLPPRLIARLQYGW